jgi:tetratricopeptide (TPR) repeat protein
VALALVAGMGTSTWLFFKEREARHRAVDAEQQQTRLRHESELREKITQAALLVSQERFEEADGLLTDISLDQPTMEGAAVFRSIGEWHALQNRWKQAANRFASLLGVNQLEGWDIVTLDYLRCGPALIEIGDASGYERFRQEAIARYSAAPGRFADRIVKISLLMPANKRVLESMSTLAEATTNHLREADAGGDVFTAAWRSLSLGLLEYRRGNFAKAVELSQRCLAYPDSNAPRTATARVILAMAYNQLGRTAEARTELQAGGGIVESKLRKMPYDRGTPIQGFWFDWAFARVLLREATALVETPRPL